MNKLFSTILALAAALCCPSHAQQADISLTAPLSPDAKPVLPRELMGLTEIPYEQGTEVHIPVQYLKSDTSVYYAETYDVGSARQVLQTLYYEITGADAATFAPLNNLYSKDCRKVYYKQNELLGAEAATFELLPYGYARDAQNVYLGSTRITGADPATFEAAGELGACATDKDYLYFQGLRTRIDRETFRKVKPGMYRDKHYVYILAHSSKMPISKVSAREYDKQQKKNER